MIKPKRFKKPLSIGLSLLMAFSFVQPALAKNTPDGSKLELKSASHKITTAKVSPKLTKQFEENNYVTYLVKLKEQVDTNKVSKNALQKASLEKVTPSAAKMAARSHVISSLRETASRTQYGLENYLDKQSESGGVKEYKSFFIVNALAVTSTKEVLDHISQLPEVDKVLPNETRYLQKVTVDKQAEGANAKTAETAETATAATAKSATVEKAVELEKDDGKTSAKPGNAGKNAVDPSTVEWNISHINAPQVWEKGIDGTGIVVANLDTGVDYTHPALHRKWRGLDAAGNVVNPELSWYDPHSHATLPVDQEDDSHGTHTMGTMVGSEENGTNRVGVAPGAKWIAVRIFNPETTDAIILDGGQWLLAPKDAQGNLHPELAPDVVNNSWGGGPGLDEWFRPVVQAWRDAQIFPEFSAGNTSLSNPGGPASVANPANYPESFATGATDSNDNLASFSLLGPSPYGEVKPEVSAPGVNIRSSVAGGAYKGGYNGTSMAGPHVAALAALLLQANHSLTVDQLEEILMNTATPRTDSTYPTSPNNGYGHGVINALDAVGSVMQGLGSVSGKVVTGGDDLEAPVLEHTPPAAAFEGIDIPLTAHVTDDVGVTAVEAFAKTAGTSNYVYIPLERTSGDSKDGTYQASIPTFLVDSAGLEYYIRVNDYGNNGFETEVYKVKISKGVKPGYTQDFEKDIAGINIGGQGSVWKWGTPTSGPKSAHSGTKVIATNLEGQYQTNSNSYFMAPPIDLTESSKGALVSFKHWYDLENNSDFGKVYVATTNNQNAFEQVLSFTGASNGWKTQYLDLRAFAGQKVYLLFNFTSDNTVVKDGWYIDDLSIQEPDTVAPAAPSNLTAEADTVGNVTLAWNASSDEDVKQYKVYRSTQSGKNYVSVGTTSALTFTDTITVGGATYHYAVAAEDYSGNEGIKSNEASLRVDVPDTLYSDHFDGSSDNGWTHSGTKDEWERGIPKEVGPESAASRPNVWATDLDSNYENGAEFSLVSPKINLQAVRNATLTFNHWFEIEAGYDYGYVEVSKNNGDTWSELGKFSHNTNGKKWAPVYYNLDSYAGNEIQIRFRLKSDNSVNKNGWYIDDFRVLGIPATTVTKDIVPESNIKLEKAEEQFPLYKITSTEKSEFQEKVKPAETTVERGRVGLDSLPASATVTVLETGRSVKTDPTTGKYSFTHVAGDYTLKAEAYGYVPQTKAVTIENNKVIRANFSLQAIPHGTIHGVITDKQSGEPIQKAKVLVVEDARIAPVETNEAGEFTLDVLEGTYTLSIAAENYYSDSVSVTAPPNGSVEANVMLKPFIGFQGGIAYDDGTGENARAFNAAGNSWAVRMTPESEVTQVTGASLLFWNSAFPNPGGTAFQYSVYDASGAAGAPGRLLAGPFDGTAVRDETQWTTVQLPEPVTVQGDFYIVYTQSAVGTQSPGLATDESSPNALRSWQGVSGTWSQSPEEEGNYMIRAIVRYPVNAPTITTPTKATYTQEETITVTGTSPAEGADIQLFNGKELAGTTKVKDRQFSLSVDLQPGANPLSVQAAVYGKITDRSEPVVVTLDQTKPGLILTSPDEGARTNAGVVSVTGTVYDEFLTDLTINGEPAEFGSDGTFNKRLLINEGENQITVTAKDLAENETTVTRSVYVDTALPKLENISPAEDVRITPGQSVRVSFDSASGLEASFHVELPFNLSTLGRNDIPLNETSSGHYEGTYFTSSSLNLEGGVIVIRVRDAAGNEVETEAPGRLYVTNGGGQNPDPNPPTSNEKPVAIIQANESAKKNKNVQFNAKASRDVDGEIVSYSWNFGDGDTAVGSKVKHKFTTAGTYTVELTVTDNDGASGKTVHTITIR
ncbi:MULTISPECIES: S8 family serine peptidase [Paenibacillus]|uniref:S8 family serine peptidase n=1 Tax=Paenibacillus TaxID=44249 RepID=UPI00041C63DE|nr:MULTISPECIES: S8 family serine peptidase [Paenibacillus]UMY53577.1 S8 family serine peptidase [Paenibacillus peoriae]